MQARYAPWWLPTALVAALSLCVILFTLLVLDSTNTTAQHQSETSGDTDTFTWKMVTTWPKNFSGLRFRARKFCAHGRRNE